MVRKLVVVAVAWGFAACASIEIASQVDPSLPALGFDRLSVAVPSQDLRFQQEFEESIAEAGAEVGVTVVPFHSLFFPGREYSDAEVLQIFEEQAIEAFMIVRNETTAPPTVVGSQMIIPGCESSVGDFCVPGGGMVMGSARARQDKFTFAADLYDLNSHEVVWVSTAAVERNGASDGAMVDRFSEKMVESLVEDRVIRNRQTLTR